MPNGWSRPEANTSLLLGLAAPSAARRTRIRPGSDSAMKMSPFGATRTVRGSRRLEANSSTWKPGGTLGAAETDFATTRGEFDADQDLAGAWRRGFLDLDEFETLDRIAEGGEVNGTHGRFLLASQDAPFLYDDRNIFRVKPGATGRQSVKVTKENGRNRAALTMAFSSEVDTGSRKENASKQEI